MLRKLYSNKILYHTSSTIGIAIITISIYISRSIRPILLIGYILVCMPLIYKSIIDYEEHNKISTMLISTAIISSIVTSFIISVLFQFLI